MLTLILKSQKAAMAPGITFSQNNIKAQEKCYLFIYSFERKGFPRNSLADLSSDPRESYTHGQDVREAEDLGIWGFSREMSSAKKTKGLKGR